MYKMMTPGPSQVRENCSAGKEQTVSESGSGL